MNSAIERFHLPQLDALRGIAALIVLLSHSGNANFIPRLFGAGFGQMGVGLFYVLSAFLLTTLYASRPVTWTRIRDYSVKRGARVLPLFYVVVLGAFAVNGLIGFDPYGAFSTITIGMKNLLLVQGTSVLWSIPVEIQFYVVFIGFWWCLRFGPIAAVVFLIGVQIVLVFIAEAGGFSAYTIPYWLHFFTAGCVLGLLFSRPEVKEFLTRSFIFRGATILAIALTPLVLPKVRRIMDVVEVYPIYQDPISIAWVLAVSAAFMFAHLPARWFDNQLFRELGRLSFGVYLVHQFYIVVLQDVFPTDPIFVGDRFVGLIVLTFATAIALNRTVEMPAQLWARRWLSGRDSQSGDGRSAAS